MIRRGDIAAALLPERPGRSLHVPVLVAKIPRLENGYNESFNGTLRYELLDAELFDTLLEAKVLIERWRIEYNTIRPHSSLGYRPPAPEAIQPRTDSATRSLPREYLVKKDDTLALT